MYEIKSFPFIQAKIFCSILFLRNGAKNLQNYVVHEYFSDSVGTTVPLLYFDTPNNKMTVSLVRISFAEIDDIRTA